VAVLQEEEKEEEGEEEEEEEEELPELLHLWVQGMHTLRHTCPGLTFNTQITGKQFKPYQLRPHPLRPQPQHV
jgi:hypothetical protein